MDWVLIGAVTFSLGLAAIALWVSCHRSKSKRKKQPGRYQREEFQIDPANVPEFKPTWRDAR